MTSLKDISTIHITWVGLIIIAMLNGFRPHGPDGFFLLILNGYALIMIIIPILSWFVASAVAFVGIQERLAGSIDMPQRRRAQAQGAASDPARFVIWVNACLFCPVFLTSPNLMMWLGGHFEIFLLAIPIHIATVLFWVAFNSFILCVRLIEYARFLRATKRQRTP